MIQRGEDLRLNRSGRSGAATKAAEGTSGQHPNPLLYGGAPYWCINFKGEFLEVTLEHVGATGRPCVLSRTERRNGTGKDGAQSRKT